MPEYEESRVAEQNVAGVAEIIHHMHIRIGYYAFEECGRGEFVVIRLGGLLVIGDNERNSVEVVASVRAHIPML